MAFQNTNIFSVLEKDDTDEKPTNKKTRRYQDRQLREGQGDYTDKRVARGGRHNKQGSRYQPKEGKRDYDRKSGTGSVLHHLLQSFFSSIHHKVVFLEDEISFFDIFQFEKMLINSSKE